MTAVGPISSGIVILLDPYDHHATLEEEEDYNFFYRFTIFDEVRQLIDTGQFSEITLHVPTDFTFEPMRAYLPVYINTYFFDNEETSVTNVTERQKIRDSIRKCYEALGEEFIERGVLDLNDHTYDDGIGLAEQLLQMNIDRRNFLVQ
jgi:hypothetical protein